MRYRDTMIEAIRNHLAEPTARGLSDAVSLAVRAGDIETGARLPPIRMVAMEFSLSPSTVSKAWQRLAQAGLVFSDGARGSYISSTVDSRPARYRRALQYSAQFEIDLSSGLPDAALLPDLAGAFSRFNGTAHSDSYLGETVLPELGAALRDDWAAGFESLTVVDGGMDGLDLIIGSVVQLGDRVAVEHPGYPPLLDILEATGARPVGVDLDDDGMVPDSLRVALDEGATVVFLQPRAQNPTGAALTQRRAAELAKLLESYAALVVEFDFAGEISSAPLVTLNSRLPSRSLHIRGYSSSFGPELRLGVIGGPTALIDPIIHRRHLGQGWTSRILQSLLLDLVTHETSIGAVLDAKREYARRRAALVSALKGHGVRVRGRDGINVWIPVANEVAALMSLASQGIGVAPGTPYAARAGMEPHICVTSGLLPVGQADEIAAALAQAGAATRAPRSA
jgi:DNA-binding transcriptional MocR family regulator